MRRLLLLLLAAGCVSAQTTGFFGKTLPQGTAGPRVLLTQSNFSYLGAFQLPLTTANGKNTVADDSAKCQRGGLTLRYVGGVFHVLTQAGGAPYSLIEWSIPTLTTSYPYNVATELKNYGSPFGAEFAGDQSCGVTWDETDQRLYWFQGFAYSNSDLNGVCYSTLDYNAGTATAIGCWSLDVAGFKAYQTQLLILPQLWAAANTGGKRLAGCCGGYWSLVGSNGGGYGPTAIAFAPRTTETNHTALPSVGMMGFYPISDTVRMPRPGDVSITQRFDGASNSLWTWSDGAFGGLRGVWIDTGTKYGVLYVNNLSYGVGCYNYAEINFDGFKHRWAIVDPADLAKGYAGSLKSDVRFASEWTVQYADYTYSAAPFAIPTTTVTSIASASGNHDPITVTATSHGRSDGDRISMTGSSVSDYNDCFILCNTPSTDAQCGTGVTGVINSNSFRATHQNAVTYSAASSTGGTMNKQWDTWYWAVAGLAYDSTTKRVYVSVPHEGGGPEIIYVYQVS